jgi:hypothetical protein
MLGLIKKLFGAKDVAPTPVEAAPAPYKVDAPAVEAAVEAAPATVVVVEGAGDVQITPAVKPAKKPAAKKPAAPKPASKPASKPAPKPKTAPKPKAKPAA